MTLGEIQQELRDMKEMIIDIRHQTRKTNGTVAKCITDIALMGQNYEVCPARLLYGNVVNNRDWSIKKLAIIIAVAGVFFTIVNIYLSLRLG